MSNSRLFAAAILVASFSILASGQESDFYATPKTAPDFWRATQFELRTGSYERASERLKGLLDLNPDDKTLFDLVDKPPQGTPGGMAQFLRLRNVPRWYAKEAPNKEAKQRVEDLIAKISKALEIELSNPERIRRFANALAGIPEEVSFALNELRRSGKAVSAVLATMLGEELAPDVKSGILSVIPQLGADTVPGFVAFLPVASPQVQVDLIDALRERSDFKGLDVAAESDIVPTLWYLTGKTDSTDIVRTKSKLAIAAATGKDLSLERDPELRTPRGQLTAYARRFADGKGNLQILAGDAKHNVWTFDGKVLKESALTRADALEYFGLRYARWALDLQPENSTTQKVFFTIAIDFHALSGGGRSLAKTAPELHAALVTAPLPLLTQLLEESIRDKKTAVVLAVVRVLGERTETKVGRSGGKPGEKAAPGMEARPSLLVRALDYPDPRVQFAAADALLRIPGPPTHDRNSQIVKILAASLAAEPEEGAKQKALLVDPDPNRADGLASVLKRVGFDVEVLRTGRQLMKRIQSKADADLVIIDRHVADPLLVDLLPQYKADFRAKNLPLLVVASPEGVTPVNLLTALARLATVISFEDLPKNPFLVLPPPEMGAKMRDIVEKVQFGPDEMRRLIYGRHLAQVEKMKLSAEKAGFAITEEMQDRIEYFSLQTFPYHILDTFARTLLDQERIIIHRLLPPFLREESGEFALSTLKGKIKSDGLPSREQAERITKLMKITSDFEAGLQVDRLPAFERLWDSFWDTQAPKLPPMEGIRNPEIESKLERMTAPYRKVRVVPAVFSELAFREGLAQGIDPKAPMISPEEKKANAKTSLTWLRKMAVGELVGYKLADAEVALRGALKSDEFAPLAVDALVRLPSKDVQLDLANLAVAPERSVPIRTQATNALIEHVQAFGSFVTMPQTEAIANSVGATEDLDLKSSLLAALGVLKADSKGTGDRLKNYVPKPAAAAQEPVPPPKEKE